MRGRFASRLRDDVRSPQSDDDACDNDWPVSQAAGYESDAEGCAQNCGDEPKQTMGSATHEEMLREVREAIG